MKSDLIDRIVKVLSEAGFQFVDCRGARSSFDVLAKLNDTVLLVKVLGNIEALSQTSVDELRAVSSMLGAVPIIVGERMKNTLLQDGVVYDRYGSCVLNASTFDQLVHNVLPKVYSTRGNYCVHVNSAMLSELRRKAGLTQEELADRIGVSKQSLYRYENSGRMSLDVFENIMDFFEDSGLVMPTFEMRVEQSRPKVVEDADFHMNRLKAKVIREFRGMGFRTSLAKAPFDVIATEEERVLTVVSNDWRRLKHKIDILDGISEIVGGYRVCVSERRVKRSRGVLTLTDLKEIKTARELFGVLSEEK